MNNRDILGEEATVRQIISDDFSATNGVFEDDSIIEIASKAIRYKSTLKKVVFPNLQKLNGQAFYGCKALKEVIMPNLVQVFGGEFINSDLKELYLPNIQGSLGSEVCRGTSRFIYAELGPGCTSFGADSFNRSWLDALVLRRTESITVMSHNSAIRNNGFLHVYVPRDLVSSYQTATNWIVRYAENSDLFRALEDYTIDGTVTGEFNKNLLKTNIQPVYSATDLEFDGSNYVDTEVKLFDSGNNFTILVDFTRINGNHNNKHLFCCGPDFNMRNNDNANVSTSSYFFTGTGSNQFIKVDFTKRVKMIFRCIGGKYISLSSSDGDVITETKVHDNGTIQNSLSNLIIGAKDDNGTKSDFWKGTVHSIKVYKGVLSGREVFDEFNL